MKWWYLIFLCLVLNNLPTNGKETRRKNSNHTCAGIDSGCRCRHGRHFEKSVICTRENCMKRLPTGDIPHDQLSKVVSLVVTRQANVTTIGSTEIRRLGNIKVIRITRCSIASVAPQAFMGLTAVEKLDLHRNKLEYVPPAIRQLQNLKYLNLGGNKLKTIRFAAFFALKKLERLILGGNSLIAMPTMLPVSLVKITVSRNELTKLGNLTYLKNLKVLMAYNNKIEVFPQLPTSIKSVSLCSNLINEDISLQPLSNLTAIDLSNNKNIGDISMSTFGNWSSRTTPKLRMFEARNSNIRSVTPNAFACLRRLRSVDISHNKIRQYQESWFSSNVGLKSVRISGNPFYCDCDVKSGLANISSVITRRKLRKNTDTTRSFQSDFDDVYCDTKGSKEPCRGLGFEDKGCTQRAYEQDAEFKSTSNTTVRPTTKKSIATTQKPIVVTTSTDAKTTTFAPVTTSSNTMKTTTFPTTPSTTASTTTTEFPTVSSTTIKTTSSPTSTTTLSTTPSTTTYTTSTSTTTPTTTMKTTTSTTSTAVPPTTTTLSTTPTTVSTTTSKPTTTSTSTSSTTTTTTSTVPSTTTRTTIRTTTTQRSTTASTTSAIVIPPIEAVTIQAPEKRCLADGRPCVFPFLYEGTEVNECVPYWRGPWCSATYNYDEDKAYGYCKKC